MFSSQKHFSGQGVFRTKLSHASTVPLKPRFVHFFSALAASGRARSENGAPGEPRGLPKSTSKSIEITPESTLVCNALFQGVQGCAPQPKMIQNGPETDANV